MQPSQLLQLKRAVTFFSNFNAIEPGLNELTLEELYEALKPEEGTCLDSTCVGKHCDSKKQGFAVSSGIFKPNKKRGDKGFVFDRAEVAFLDLDEFTEAQLQEFLPKLDGIECFIASTHSHKSPNHCAYRVTFPLSRAVRVDEWSLFWRQLVAHFGVKADKACKDIGRLYYLPRFPKGRVPESARSEGSLLDVDAILLAAHKFIVAERSKPPTPPKLEEVDDGSTDLAALRKRIKDYSHPNDFDGEKEELIRRLLAGEPLADKPGGSLEQDAHQILGRDDAIYRVGGILGTLLPAETSEDAVRELVHLSISKLPMYPGDGTNENYDGWMAKLLGNFAKAQKLKFEELEAVRQLTFRHSSTTPSLAQSVNETEEVVSDPDAWRPLMKTVTNESGISRPLNIGFNIITVLRHHPAWKNTIRLNELTQTVEYIGEELPQAFARASLMDATAWWLQEKEALLTAQRDVEAAVRFAAKVNSYDPVKQYLEPLTWDGTPRLETLFETYFGAETMVDNVDITSYLRAIGPKWLIGAVARGLKPGSMVDYCVVLEGLQGVGKTSALKILGGPFYSKSENVLISKDMLMGLTRTWFVELAELSSIRNTQVEAQKAFFSETVDRFRPPYGREVEEFPRHCIFVGTTNESNYLRDETGNRRFWVVPTGMLDLKALECDRDQLFAEAKDRYLAGEEWFFRSGNDIGEMLATSRLRTDGLKEKIQRWWRTTAPENRPRFVIGSEVAEHALGFNTMDYTRMNGHIGRTLKSLGFKRTRITDPVDGRQQWVYVPTEQMLKEERTSLRLVHPAAVSGGT